MHVALLLHRKAVSLGIHQNTWKYNVWGIKLEMKVMRLHKIQVEKILSLQNKYAVHNFGQLPVIYQVQLV